MCRADPGPHRAPTEDPGDDATPADSSPVVVDPQGGPPLELDVIPPPRPGVPHVVSSGPAGTQQVALTVDDGYCKGCIAQYVAFAESSALALHLESQRRVR